MIRIALALACLCTLAAPALAQVERRSFRDWEAGLRSDALGWVATKAVRAPKTDLARAEPARFELLRGAGPAWHAVIATPEPLDAAKPIALRLDGETRTIPPGGTLARDAAEALTIQHAETLGYLAANLRNAKALSVAATARGGKAVELEFSLSGLAAAMLWLDEKQRRTGKPAAFAAIEPPAKGPFHAAPPADPSRAPGPGGTSAGDDPDPIPVSVALPLETQWPQDLRGLPPAVLERHAMLGNCEEPVLVASAGAEPRGRFWTARLDPWVTVYVVGCWSAAYNAAARLYLVTTGKFRELQPLSFAEPDGVDGWDATDVLVNPAIDESKGELTTFNKGRGLGDCGTLGTWRWTGARFSLREYRAEADCNGRTPEKWPVLFRAKPK